LSGNPSPKRGRFQPARCSTRAREPAGRGVAYATTCNRHLLNVPAENMSIFPDVPDHFLDWAQQHYDPRTEKDSFVPRPIYGQYIEHTLRAAQSEACSRLEWMDEEVVGIRPAGSGAEIRFAHGNRLLADRVVLAQGNFRAADPPLRGLSLTSSRYKSYAWSPDALKGVENEGSVLLLGTGLTAVDLVMSLQEQGFRGVVHLLSRRGLVPQAHKKARAWPSYWSQNSPRTVRGLLQIMRAQVKLGKRTGVTGER